MSKFWSSLQIFDEKEIRAYYYAEQKLWLFSAADVCNALIETSKPNECWANLKQEVEKK